MAMNSKPPVKPAGASPGFAHTVPAQLEPYVPGDVLPVPEVIEKDSDSVWQLWSNAVDGPASGDTEAQGVTQLMGLDELPKNSDT